MEKSWAGRSAGGGGHIHPPGVNTLMLQRTATASESSVQLSRSDYRRLLIDMQKTVRERDQAIELLQSERDRLSKHCRIQRKLIAHLRQQRSQWQELLRSEQASRPLQQVSVAGAAASDSKRKNHGRVKSLDSALLRINGGGPVEEALPDEDINRAELDKFDLEEFQPIVDFDAEPGLLDQLRVRAVQLATWSSAQLSAQAVFARRNLQRIASGLHAALRARPWMSHQMVSRSFMHLFVVQVQSAVRAIKAWRRWLNSNSLQKAK